MIIRPLSLSALFVVALAASFALPPAANAGGRRNYAEEWRREERAEERREERERARREWQEHQSQQQQRYLDNQADSQQRSHQHQQRQLDRVLDFYDGEGRVRPAASAPAAPRKKSGTCIYGAGNKVLYQPDGVDCNQL